MILACNYEEVTALTYGARGVLASQRGSGSAVAAPSEGLGAVEALLPQLSGDLAVYTIREQRQVERAVRIIVHHLRDEMSATVRDTHPAHEDAVGAYFDFAHALAFLNRVQELGEEMHALMEVITGEPPNPETARTFRFPD